MKTARRMLSVLLCCVLLAAFAPFAYAEDTLIEEVFATYTVPIAGEAFDFSAVTVPLDAHYTAKIVKVYAEDGSQILASGDVVQAGVRYRVRVHFVADKGYRIDDDKTVFTINGEASADRIGAGLAETVLIPAKAPDTPTPEKPTFRDRAAAFLRDMRNRFLYFIFWLRSLFGIRK